MTKKKVGIQLPRQAQNQTVEQRWSLELEALAPIADIVEIRADTPEEFAEGVRDVDAIITSWGLRIDKQVIDALEKAVCIGVGSVGVDMVDIEAATAAGLVVTNVPDVFIEEVADHAMALLLDLARRTPTMVRMAKDGDWYQARPLLSKIPRLYGQTLGLFAFGNVAHCTARRAKAFGMRVIACDPYVSELEITKEGVEPVSFNELLERSDYLSIHSPHNEETEHAFNASAFERMQETAVIINTARGPIIDEAALIEALRTGQIAGRDLEARRGPARDVVQPQRRAVAHDEAGFRCVIGPPHLAGLGEHDVARLGALVHQGRTGEGRRLALLLELRGEVADAVVSGLHAKRARFGHARGADLHGRLRRLLGEGRGRPTGYERHDERRECLSKIQPIQAPPRAQGRLCRNGTPLRAGRFSRSRLRPGASAAAPRAPWSRSGARSSPRAPSAQ